MIHAQLKHQDRTRTVADLPGSPYPAHLATQCKVRVQGLAMIKHSDGAPGSLCGPPVASSAVHPAHISMLPNRRRLGMRLGSKLSPDGYLQTSGDPSRLSRRRKVRLRSASSSAFAHGMTFSAGYPFGSFATSRLYILVAGRPLPEDQIAGHSRQLPVPLPNTFLVIFSLRLSSTHYDNLISTTTTSRCSSPLFSLPGLPRP